MIVSTVTLSSSKVADDAMIKVSITNLRNNKGHVLISLFKDGEGYPDKPERSFRRAKVIVSNKMAVVVFEKLPAGSYAIAMLHDENDDLKMNTNILGIPKEGYGFSNNVMGAFSPPSYSKASIAITSGAVITSQIKARY